MNVLLERTENNINRMLNSKLTNNVIIDINAKIDDLIHYGYKFSDTTIDNIFYNIYIINNYDYFCVRYYSLRIFNNDKNINMYQMIEKKYNIYPKSIIIDYIIENDLHNFFKLLNIAIYNDIFDKILKFKAMKILQSINIFSDNYKTIMSNYKENRLFFNVLINNRSFMSTLNVIDYILMNNDFEFIDNIIDHYLINKNKKEIINIIEHNYLLKLPIEIYDKFIFAFCKLENIKKEELIKNKIYRGYVKPYRLPAIELKKCFIRSCINNYDNKLNLLNIDVINYICNKI